MPSIAGAALLWQRVSVLFDTITVKSEVIFKESAIEGKENFLEIWKSKATRFRLKELYRSTISGMI